MKPLYTTWLVVLSVVVAVLVSYTALRLAARVAESRTTAGRIWLVLGSVSMGVGIWSMHFIGMLAMQMPIPLHYSIGTTLASLVVGIVTSGFAIHIASRPQLGTARHLVCSVVMGAGISAMHYTGMEAILIVPGISYALAPLIASILIAIAASWCALWLTFVLRTRVSRHALLARMTAALLMGAAIAGMHYTGMGAAMFAPGSYCLGGIVLDSNWLAIGIAVGTFCILAITLMTMAFDRHMVARAAALQDRLHLADQKLVHQATHDSLTGLPNRQRFLQCLERAICRVEAGAQQHLAVLFLDFDRFKFINDSFGHAAGDELLRQISNRLVRELGQVQETDEVERPHLVSRFGGDEFLILLNQLHTPEEAMRVARRLLASLSPGYHVLGTDLHCGVSIGVVTGGRGCPSADELVRNADVAMYEAKRAGRGCAVQFDESMHRRIARHVTIENCLRRAIGTDELQVVYQPIIELSTSRLVSVEALVRWLHPELGVVSPSEFIPVAEESGLIVELDRWVRHEACCAMKMWRERNPDLAPETVSVNVSRFELAQGAVFRDRISNLLRSVALPPGCLQLEVTEREVMRDPDATLALMKELRGLGVKLAMDDFGTGTSSLSILRTYPFDTIKIDRSFVQGLVGHETDVLAVIHATVRLVEHLGMASLVEGIEEPSQLSVLMSIGCRFGQGYLFSRPVTAERLLDLLGVCEARITGEELLALPGTHGEVCAA